MEVTTPTPFPPAVSGRRVPPASFEFGFTELPLSRETSTLSPPLPEIPFSRHTSPILVSSFELNDGCQWGDGPADSQLRPFSARHGLHCRELSLSSLNDQDRGYSETLCRVLVFFGWLPRLKSGARKHLPFLVTFSLNFFVLTTTVRGGFVFGPSEGRIFGILHRVDSLARHFLIMVAHLGMYFVGGDDMSAAFRALECSVPHGHFMGLAMFTGLEFGLDIILLYFRHVRYMSDTSRTAWQITIAVLRRSFIIVERIPSAVSLMVMMSIPKRLCQDLVRTAIAIDTHDIPEAQRSYCVFWKHLRMGRRWYNAVMTAHFLIVASRIPIGIYIVTHLNEVVRSERRYETILLLAYTTIDSFQLLVWLQPAIVIRMNHGVVFRAAVEAAGQQTENATALATMMASLHPLAGLKMLGFLVTWNLVAKATTFTTIVLAGLRFLVKRS